MQSIQSTNPPSLSENFLQGENFLQALPRDIISNICSLLTITQVSYVNSLSKSFADFELSNMIWQNLAHTQLRAAYQNLHANLPGATSKEKVKIYHNDLKDTVHSILRNANWIIGNKDLKSAFDINQWNYFREFISHLADTGSSLTNKLAAIKGDPKLGILLRQFYHFTAGDLATRNPQIFKACFEVMELLLKLTDLNVFSDKYPYHPLIFDAVKDERIDIAKKLIDAGADFDQSKIYEYVLMWSEAGDVDFPVELFDEIIAYAEQRKACINKD